MEFLTMELFCFEVFALRLLMDRLPSLFGFSLNLSFGVFIMVILFYCVFCSGALEMVFHGWQGASCGIGTSKLVVRFHFCWVNLFPESNGSSFPFPLFSYFSYPFWVLYLSFYPSGIILGSALNLFHKNVLNFYYLFIYFSVC